MPRRRDRTYCVYIVASKTRVIYIGVTGAIMRRMWQHKYKIYQGFTSKYNVDRLVYVERYTYIFDALNREKQLKKFARRKKVALIELENPRWLDLSEEWFDLTLPKEAYEF